MAIQSLRTKLVLVLSLILMLIFTVQILSRQFIELPQFYELERVADIKDAKGVNQAIDSMAFDLAETALDFGIWTETYDYMQQPNLWFTQQYFTYYVYYSKNINGFILADKSANIVYQRAYDWSDGSLIMQPVFDQAQLEKSIYEKLNKLPDGNVQHATLKGFIDSKLGLLQFAASKILPSSGKGESRGMVVAWRFVDEGFKAELRRRHKTDVALLAINTLDKNSNYMPVVTTLMDTKVEVMPRQNNKIQWLINDIDDKSALFAELELEQRQFNSGGLSSPLLLGMLTALLSLLVIGYFISTKIILPMQMVQSVLADIIQTGNYENPLAVKGKDEIGDTIVSINHLLKKIHSHEQSLLSKNRALEKLTEEDALTRVLNRRGFDTSLSRLWNEALKTKTPIAIFLIDVDNFKRYNDNYGHPAGDRVLKMIAACLQDQLHKATDTVARHGGEEFAVILTQTSAENAMIVANRLCLSISDLNIVHQHQEHSSVVTISVGGIINTPQSTDGYQAAVSAADQCLYSAKESGRNRVVFSSGAEAIKLSAIGEIS